MVRTGTERSGRFAVLCEHTRSLWRTRTMPRFFLWLPACLLTMTAIAAADDGAAVKLTKESNRIVVTIGGQPFTDYYYGPEAARPYVRPFMWPVRAADGTGVTSDQVQSDNPKEHPHHRSL